MRHTPMWKASGFMLLLVGTPGVGLSWAYFQPHIASLFAAAGMVVFIIGLWMIDEGRKATSGVKP